MIQLMMDVHKSLSNYFVLIHWIQFLLVHVSAAVIEMSEAEKLEDIAKRYWSWKMREFPTFATAQKNHKYDDVIEDFSFEAFDRREAACKELIADVDALNLAQLSRGDKQNAAVLKADLSYFVQGYQWRMYGALTPLNFLEGIHRSPSWVKHMRFKTEEHYNMYLSRMRAVETGVEQGITLMKKAIELNRTNHEVSMRGVPRQIEEGLLIPANRTVYFFPFTTEYLIQFNQSYRSYLQNTGYDIIKNSIQPAYVRLKEFIENVYSKHTRQHHGVGKFDGGLGYYHACLRFHLSTDVTAAEVRDTGLKEVKRIKENMEKIMRREGFDGALQDFVGHLRKTRRKEFYDRNATQLLQEFRYIIYQRIDPKLTSVLHHIPSEKVRVETVESGGPAALYFPNTGVFQANVRHPETRPTFTMMALALHEANPGHHLQITYAGQQAQPEFRRVLWGTKYYAVPFNFPWYTAYTEGWGLYAEYLGEEMGLYNKSALELFGRYSSEIFRACRLVVDTGIHAFGMSRMEAIQYIADHTAIPRSQIEKEVDRYITWPGQACAYKMGELAILRLRKRAEKELGDGFDVKLFNNEVLQAGRVPMHLLEKSIEEWIVVQKGIGSRSRESKYDYVAKSTNQKPLSIWWLNSQMTYIIMTSIYAYML